MPLDTLRSPKDSKNMPTAIDPRMPEVAGPPDVDLDQAFGLARIRAIGAELSDTVARNVVLVTPGRSLISYGCPKPGSVANEDVAGLLGRRFPPSPTQNIAVIAYTEFKAAIEDVGKAIPFFGMLRALAYLGHAVWVFEGHPSAFEAGVSKANVLFVDSGMMPFLQLSWFSVAQRVLAPDARIYVHDREHSELRPAVESTKGPGWELTEPDHIGSYVNCLCCALMLNPDRSVRVEAGCRLPNLQEFPTDEAVGFIWKTPFRYETLDARDAIAVINANAKGRVGRTRTIDATVAETGTSGRIMIKAKRSGAIEMWAEPR